MGKNKANKRITRLANKIAELENEIRQGKNVEAAQSEIEKIDSLTKNLNIVGYEGENVTGYANMFISEVLGYKKETIGEHSWEEGTWGKIGDDGLVVSEIFDRMRMVAKST